MTDNFSLLACCLHVVQNLWQRGFQLTPSASETGVHALQNRMHMVIGKPIEIPKLEAPTKEQTQRYLDVYIDALQALFERHKAAAGCPDLKLIVI